MHKALLMALALPLATPAHAGPWVDGEAQRLELGVDVQLPRFLWFVADFNEQARATAFQVHAVMDCLPERISRKRLEVACTIDDISLAAAPMPSEVGELEPVLTEMDRKLTGATLVLEVREDGRITNLALRQAQVRDQRNRRIRQMDENLRLILARLVAGLDLEQPRKGLQDGATWAQRQTLLTQAPSTLGTLGATELIHQVQRVEDGRIEVVSAGEAVIAPANAFTDAPADLFDTELAARAWLTPEGRLRSRTWGVVGRPTPSSALADGTAGLPYTQRGVLRALEPGETPELAPTREIAPGQGPSAIQSETSWGETFGPAGRP